MKRNPLIKTIVGYGSKFLRHGRKHDVWMSRAGKPIHVPRHNDIPEGTAREIIKDAMKE